MTHDQYGQAQGTGGVVQGEVVPDEGTGESPAERAAPATSFQEVAAPPDAPADHDDADGTGSEEVGAAFGSLLPDAPAFRQRWHQVQFRFVDDPKGSVTEAADVIAQVTAELEAAIAERQRSLHARWSEGTSGDTETLRATLLMYRAFLDQLTGTG